MMGGNTLRSGGAFNSYDPEGQASTKMDDSLKATVEKLLAVEPVSDAHKQLIEDVQKQYEMCIRDRYSQGVSEEANG